MRIAFVGTVEFSASCLRKVLASGGDVVGIVTLAEENARFNSDFADLGPIAREHGIPLARVVNINDEDALGQLRTWRPDVIFVFGWSQLLSETVREIAPMGCIGTHPALLPRNRGRHPLIWALIEDLTESGLTFFYLDEGADSGDILWQERFEITDDDDAGTLYGKIIGLADDAIPELLAKIASGTAERTAQRPEDATYWPKRSAEDGIIRWDAPARSVFNLVRALTHPYPGARTTLRGDAITVWKCHIQTGEAIATEPGAKPGTVIDDDGGTIRVATADGSVVITDWTAPGGAVIQRHELLGS